MKRLVKTSELVAYIAVSFVLVIIAISLSDGAATIFNLLTLPFCFAGNILRQMGNGFFTVVLYVCLCLLPLIFPFIMLLKRKAGLRHLTWTITSAFCFLALYYFINPHKAGLFADVVLLGLAVTIYALLILGVLQELNFRQKTESGKVFVYAKILIYVLIAGLLFNIFFLKIISMKSSLIALKETLQPIVSQDFSINVFAVLFEFFLWLLPVFFNLKLLLQAKDFVDSLQEGMFEPKNLIKLNAISKTCKQTIFFSIAAVVANNLVIFLLRNKLVDMTFSIDLPVQLILTACLIVIFSKMLVKAIKINEENKLTI